MRRSCRDGSMKILQRGLGESLLELQAATDAAAIMDFTDTFVAFRYWWYRTPNSIKPWELPRLMKNSQCDVRIPFSPHDLSTICDLRHNRTFQAQLNSRYPRSFTPRESEREKERKCVCIMCMSCCFFFLFKFHGILIDFSKLAALLFPLIDFSDWPAFISIRFSAI